MEKRLKPSTQAISEFHPKDEWIVIVNRKEYILNGSQVELLKKATQENFRGVVWFKKFAISIPHVQEIYRSKSGEGSEKYKKMVERQLE